VDLSRDPTKANKILKQYSNDVFARWIPSTYIDESGLIQGQDDLSMHIPYSGKWGVYERNKKGKEYLIYIVETQEHNYRDITEIDLWNLYKADRYKQSTTLNPEKWNPAKDVNERNRERDMKIDRRFRSEVREKAKDMWGTITNRPYITAGTPWK
jgi:hypothetical protein